MASPKILVTGSCGLVGSDVAVYFGRAGFTVTGIDDNHRAVFFGPEGDTSWALERLRAQIPGYRHEAFDIRDRQRVLHLAGELRPDLIVHAAAQPSHDRAAAIPFLDFEVNALGTLHLLEAARQFCPASPFIHMSTNKVYGDRPNRIALRELDTRWDYADPAYENGIPEDFPIDQSKHSLFGASKLAADVMVQEYGRYFGMPTCCLRGGCLTGPSQAGVELPRQVQCAGTRVQGLRLPGKAGPRQHSLPGRRVADARVLQEPPGRRSIQSGRRQGQLLLHPGSFRAGRTGNRQEDALAL
jgi:CDP-paratose 2-epimerase